MRAVVADAYDACQEILTSMFLSVAISGLVVWLRDWIKPKVKCFSVISKKVAMFSGGFACWLSPML